MRTKRATAAQARPSLRSRSSTAALATARSTPVLSRYSLIASILVAVMNLYLDDSGTRNPDRSPGQVPGHGYDWFGIGGIMLRDEDEDVFRAAHAALRTKWKITGPLHSSEIRSKTDGFRWLRGLPPETQTEFIADITALATRPELTVIACVIDRPGYNHRYLLKYGRDRRDLCKTAFSIVVERSAKYARDLGCRLRVNIERSDKKTDRLIHGYYDELRGKGHPFDARSAAKYGPYVATDFAETLYEFRTKDKPRHRYRSPTSASGQCVSAATALTTSPTLHSRKPVFRSTRSSRPAMLRTAGSNIAVGIFRRRPRPQWLRTNQTPVSDRALGSHRWVTSWARPICKVLHGSDNSSRLPSAPRRSRHASP